MHDLRSSDSHNPTVLIIEDDADIAEVLRIALEHAKINTRVALSGEEGLALSLDRQNPPAVILLDHLLPGMSGLEICRRLRNEPLTHDLPILMVTANASRFDINAGLQIGANAYITKPFAVREVVAMVQLLLEQAHSH